MRLFHDCKGYATEKTAIAKLARVLPGYDDYHWLIVALPNGRYQPVVRVSGTDLQYAMAALAHADIGVI